MRIGEMPRGSVAHVVQAHTKLTFMYGFVMLTTEGFYRPAEAADFQHDPRVHVELDATGLTKADFDLLTRVEFSPQPGPDGRTLTLRAAVEALARLRDAKAQQVLDKLLRTYAET